jgi:hypothetical protein
MTILFEIKDVCSQVKLSSRPERSVVEGAAVSFCPSDLTASDKSHRPPLCYPLGCVLMNNRPGDPSKVSVMRWLGDKSLACSQALPPGRVPQVRTSEPGKKKPGAKPHQSFYIHIKVQLPPRVKACEKNHFQPRYAGANLGHPSRGQGLAGSRESGGERTANRLTELLAIGESTAPNDKVRVCASMQRTDFFGTL